MADDADIVERVPVRSCQRRGAAVDLVLDRARENRSQFVFTQGPRSRRHLLAVGPHDPPGPPERHRADRPGRRSAAGDHRRQPRALPVDVQPPAGRRRRGAPCRPATTPSSSTVAIVAAVERKSLADLVSTMTSGKLRYLLADLARAARRPRSSSRTATRRCSSSTTSGPSIVADGLGEAAARFPAVPIVFAETRPLAQEWTYRFLGAALAHHHDDVRGHAVRRDLASRRRSHGAGDRRPPRSERGPASTASPVPDRGRLRARRVGRLPGGDRRHPAGLTAPVSGQPPPGAPSRRRGGRR